MTLHETTELGKKIAIGAGIGIVASVMIFIFVKVGIFFWKVAFPPPLEPPKLTYDKLPPIKFPPNVYNGQLSYKIDTNTGDLPSFPGRLVILPVIPSTPNILNLENIKNKVNRLGFASLTTGETLPEVPLGGPYYEWEDPTGINRKITFNIITFDFEMTSNYLSSLTVLRAQRISDEQTAFYTATDFLSSIDLLPDDLDQDKTKTRHPDDTYLTYPQLFSITNGTLVPAPSLSTTQVIRVDLYQKDIEYELHTGKVGEVVQMKVPILYPTPPYSTMNFWVASGENEPEVMTSQFTHQKIDKTNLEATYPIITTQQAFENLQNGKAYIAAYHGNSSIILINKVYLAYYMGKDPQPYLMPVIVFEGRDGFMAYVSVVSDEWLE